MKLFFHNTACGKGPTGVIRRTTRAADVLFLAFPPGPLVFADPVVLAFLTTIKVFDIFSCHCNNWLVSPPASVGESTAFPQRRNYIMNIFLFQL